MSIKFSCIGDGCTSDPAVRFTLAQRLFLPGKLMMHAYLSRHKKAKKGAGQFNSNQAVMQAKWAHFSSSSSNSVASTDKTAWWPETGKDLVQVQHSTLKRLPEKITTAPKQRLQMKLNFQLRRIFSGTAQRHRFWVPYLALRALFLATCLTENLTCNHRKVVKQSKRFECECKTNHSFRFLWWRVHGEKRHPPQYSKVSFLP